MPGVVPEPACQHVPQALRRVDLGAGELAARSPRGSGIRVLARVPGRRRAGPAAANPMAAAAHRYSSTVAVERMSRRAVLTDPRKAYTADRTQTAIMTINIGSQLVRL